MVTATSLLGLKAKVQGQKTKHFETALNVIQWQKLHVKGNCGQRK